jgi:hypothetical protein
MAWISVGRADIKISELGSAAFEGERSAVLAAIQSGINWRQEGCDLLHGALYANDLELVKTILAAGSPVCDESYYVAFDYSPAALALLPARPELTKKIEASRRWPAFNWALVNEDEPLAQKLLEQGVPINDSILISHGMGNLSPIHYAVRKGNLRLVRMVVEAGANVNSLNPEGKSPLRLVLENPLLPSSQRKEVAAYLQAKGAKIVPAPTKLQATLAFWFGCALVKAE